MTGTEDAEGKLPSTARRKLYATAAPHSTALALLNDQVGTATPMPGDL
jgi:hypothetical protein